jgi:hypothetical protein
MPAIKDGILVGDIEDSDESFQKWGRLGRLAGKNSNSRGIVYTTAAALESAKKALPVAELEVEVNVVAVAHIISSMYDV